MSEILKAVFGGDIGALRSALSKSAAEINEKDEVGATALFEAVSSMQIDMVEILLDFGADPNVAEVNGISPLMEAASAARLDIFELLIKHGADPNRRDDFGDGYLEYSRKPGTRLALLRLVEERTSSGRE